MPTGFDKFSKKALAEEGISLKPKTAAQPEQEKTPEEKEVKKLTATVRAGEKKAKKEEAPKEETFQMTIVIKMDTKRKLDELKFVTRKSYKELAEEAFEDLYRKMK